MNQLGIHFTLLAIFSLALVATGRQMRLMIILRFLPLFLITFLLNAFTEPGHFLVFFPYATKEGVFKGGHLVLRMINLVALSLLLVKKEDLFSI